MHVFLCVLKSTCVALLSLSLLLTSCSSEIAERKDHSSPAIVPWAVVDLCSLMLVLRYRHAVSVPPHYPSGMNPSKLFYPTGSEE